MADKEKADSIIAPDEPKGKNDQNARKRKTTHRSSAPKKELAEEPKVEPAKSEAKEAVDDLVEGPPATVWVVTQKGRISTKILVVTANLEILDGMYDLTEQNGFKDCDSNGYGVIATAVTFLS